MGCRVGGESGLWYLTARYGIMLDFMTDWISGRVPLRCGDVWSSGFVRSDGPESTQDESEAG